MERLYVIEDGDERGIIWTSADVTPDPDWIPVTGVRYWGMWITRPRVSLLTTAAVIVAMAAAVVAWSR